MSRPRVFYTHWAPAEGPAILRPRCEVVERAPGPPLSEDEIVRGIGEATALCFSVRDRVTRKVLESGEKLRVVSSFGRGSDNIDLECATELGIWVATVDSTMSDPVADLTWALLLAAARRVLAGDGAVRSGRFDGWEARPSYPGVNVHGRTLGIVGLGEIGRAVSRRAAGFAMRVLYWQPRRLDPGQEEALGATWVERGELFSRADFLCICSPLTADTYHLVGEKELRAMKPTAVLVNTSRGSEVDEEAVARALAEGRLGGYAADVFEMEDSPPVPAVPPERRGIPRLLLEQKDRTVFTPHASTAIEETRILIAIAQARAVLDVLEGRRPASAVNEPLHPRGGAAF